MKHLLVGLAVTTYAVFPSVAGDIAGSLADRERAWTVAALGTAPSEARPSDRYELEWQRQLLAFQVAYAKELASPPDLIETGSITEAE